MESLNNILKKSLNKEFLSAIISNPREKGGIVKIKIRPVEHKDNILYQCEEHRNNQVFHHNLNEEEAAGYIENAMQEFKQMQMETRKFRYQVLVSKPGGSKRLICHTTGRSIISWRKEKQFHFYRIWEL